MITYPINIEIDDKDKKFISEKREVFSYAFRKGYKKYANNIITLESTGESKLGRIFDLIYLGDWVSYYLAILNEVNPTPVDVISYLKNKLEKISM